MLGWGRDLDLWGRLAQWGALASSHEVAHGGVSVTAWVEQEQLKCRCHPDCPAAAGWRVSRGLEVRARGGRAPAKAVKGQNERALGGATGPQMAGRACTAPHSDSQMHARGWCGSSFTQQVTQQWWPDHLAWSLLDHLGALQC